MSDYCIHFDTEEQALEHLRSLPEMHNHAIVEGPDEQWSVVDAETAKEFEPWRNI